MYHLNIKLIYVFHSTEDDENKDQKIFFESVKSKSN